MSTSAARIGGGFLALAAIWIGVYWFWEPSRSAGVSFAEPTGEPETAPLVTHASPPPDDPETAALRAPVETPPAGSREPDPAEASPDEPTVTPPEFQEYTIRKNDTFASISRKFFGTERHASAIARANPLMSPTSLREGRKVRVPLDPENIQGVPTQPDAPLLETPQMLEYVVVRNDTLSGLAQRFYGSLRYADVIFNANRDTLSSPDALQLGQVLRIPPRESVLGDADE